MTVGELIEELKKFDKDINVEVQLRDDSGDFCGTDDCIYLRLKNDTLIL